mmetsp:Transcript_9233/g.31931  ORF Transcript_9233/g.31931 Transcript_9233/m.31931 type:complete len:428 (+) Transcript_9233:781-2064(+)
MQRRAVHVHPKGVGPVTVEHRAPAPPQGSSARPAHVELVRQALGRHEAGARFLVDVARAGRRGGWVLQLELPHGSGEGRARGLALGRGGVHHTVMPGRRRGALLGWGRPRGEGVPGLRGRRQGAVGREGVVHGDILIQELPELVPPLRLALVRLHHLLVRLHLQQHQAAYHAKVNAGHEVDHLHVGLRQQPRKVEQALHVQRRRGVHQDVAVEGVRGGVELGVSEGVEEPPPFCKGNDEKVRAEEADHLEGKVLDDGSVDPHAAQALLLRDPRHVEPVHPKEEHGVDVPALAHPNHPKHGDGVDKQPVGAGELDEALELFVRNDDLAAHQVEEREEQAEEHEAEEGKHEAKPLSVAGAETKEGQYGREVVARPLQLRFQGPRPRRVQQPPGTPCVDPRRLKPRQPHQPAQSRGSHVMCKVHLCHGPG